MIFYCSRIRTICLKN